MRQRQQKGGHRRYLQRHEKRRRHIGGNHVRALRQRRHQRLRHQRVNLLGKGQQREQAQHEHRRRPQQAAAQFDQVLDQGLARAQLFFAQRRLLKRGLGR